jgi:hypothetical protein
MKGYQSEHPRYKEGQMEIREDIKARWNSTVWDLTEMARDHSCVPSDVIESKVRALFEVWLNEQAGTTRA